MDDIFALVVGAILTPKLQFICGIVAFIGLVVAVLSGWRP
jgi:hypothetical protein